MISPILVSGQFAGAPPSRNKAVEELEEAIHSLETMRDLMTQMGNSGKAQEISRAIEVRRHQMVLARQPEREFSPGCVAEIQGFLDARAAVREFPRRLAPTA
ncbi:MAG: hypothetical protein FJX76_13405 [Armatimonadetes bacterium]|nr:hypothetical protein [Armatimonadota bacterium]